MAALDQAADHVFGLGHAVVQFDRWLADALATDILELKAMTLSTVDEACRAALLHVASALGGRQPISGGSPF